MYVYICLLVNICLVCICYFSLLLKSSSQSPTWLIQDLSCFGSPFNGCTPFAFSICLSVCRCQIASKISTIISSWRYARENEGRQQLCPYTVVVELMCFIVFKGGLWCKSAWRPPFFTGGIMFLGFTIPLLAVEHESWSFVFKSQFSSTDLLNFLASNHFNDFVLLIAQYTLNLTLPQWLWLCFWLWLLKHFSRA